MNKTKGFTLIEFVIYIAIFTSLALLLMNIFSNFVKIQNRQNFLNNLTQEFNFVSSVIERLVKNSSLIENQVGIETTTLILRMSKLEKDPTIIYYDKNTKKIYLKEGNNESISLISDKVIVKDFKIVKFENPGSKSFVEINLTLENNIDNPNLKFSQTMQTAIGRISAATFDSSLVPNSPGLYDIGASGYTWKDAYFSGQVGIGTVSIGSGVKLGISGGNFYLKDAGGGIILKTPDGNNCYKISITNSGIVTSSLVACP